MVSMAPADKSCCCANFWHFLGVFHFFFWRWFSLLLVKSKNIGRREPLSYFGVGHCTFHNEICTPQCHDFKCDSNKEKEVIWIDAELQSDIWSPIFRMHYPLPKDKQRHLFNRRKKHWNCCRSIDRFLIDNLPNAPSIMERHQHRSVDAPNGDLLFFADFC